MGRYEVGLWLGMCVAACGGADPRPVRVVDLKPDLTGCDPRGRVDAKGKSQPEARMRLENAARELDADTVWIDQPVELAPAGRTKLHGLAFRCHGRSAQAVGAEQPTAAGTAPSSATAPSAPQASPPPEEPASLEERLRELQQLYEKGLITQEDYDARREQLLQEL